MSKTNKTTKQETVIELKEKVNFDILSRILSAEGISDKTRKQLNSYYHKRKNDAISVKYHFSKKLKDFGRLYAEKSLSLQSIKKEIRHSLAKEIYHDIDMENSHPRLILQYCKNKNIVHRELENYVMNRDKMLKMIIKKHKCDREQAKHLILRLCYLGKYVIKKNNDDIFDFDEDLEEYKEVEPENKIKEIIKFQKEMRNIANSICDIEEEMYEKVKKDNKTENKKARTLSILAQKIEHECLMAMYEYFTKSNYNVGVLCFDGLMVEKSEKLDNNIDKILKSCEKYVNNKTKYEIKLAVKPMDIELSFILPQFSEYVESDRDCQDKLFKIEGREKFKFCFDCLYIFNEKTGMYDMSTNGEMVYSYLIKNRKYLNVIKSVNEKTGEAKLDNYGDSAVLQNKVLQFIKTEATDNEWLERTELTSVGYLLFNDGIYDMKKDKFTKGFNPNIVFHARIPYDFPKRNEEEVKNAFEISFGRIFKDPEPMIAALASAISGEIELKRFYFCPGRSNAGKSYLLKMLKKTFGGFVHTFNAEVLAHSSSMDSKDEAARNRWAFLLRYVRILLSQEINMRKSLDGN